MVDVDFRTSAAVFMLMSASKEEVRVAGEDALIMMYGSSKEGNLNSAWKFSKRRW